MSNADMDAIYARVSTGRQEKEKTIDAQLHAIHKKFDGEGRELHDTYLDQNVSGTVLHRTGLNACLAAAMAGKFNRLLVDHPDRLARGEAWMRPFIEREFVDAGVRIEYASYTRQDSSEGQMMDDMVNAFSAYERRQIMRRMADGRASKLARGGVWRAQRPYGWRYEKPAPGERDGRVTRVTEEAPIVRAIFDWVLAGKTSYWVADELNRAGHRARNGGLWYDKAVQVIVKNPIHTGWAPIDGSQPEAEWQWVEVGPAIVSREEWQRARAQLSANKSFSKRNATHEYPLRKLLRCGYPIEGQPDRVCGRVLTGRADVSGKRRYRCTRKKGSDPACSHTCGRYVIADIVEEAVLDTVLDSLRHPWQVVAQWQRQQAGTDAELERLAAQLCGAHDRCKAAQKKLDDLLDLRVEGGIDPTTFARKQAEYVAARDSHKAEIAHLELEIARAGQQQVCQRELMECLSACVASIGGEALGMFTLWSDEQQAFLRQFVREVWIMPDGTYRVDFRVAASEAAPENVTVRQSSLRHAHSYHTAKQPREFRWSVVIAA